MTRFRAAALAVAGGVVLAAGTAVADQVTPTDGVQSRVVVRQQATRRSSDVGSLRPGEEAELLDSESGWHRVRLADGTPGYVSTAWTLVIPTPEPEPALAEESYTLETRRRERGWLAALARFLRRNLLPIFTSMPRVNLRIEQPEIGSSVHRHYDPNLPVSGFATAGSKGLYDVMLVIDLSASTNEFAETDVDEDGVAEDVWKGPDSILQAQVRAARNFVGALRRLPGNREGARIRVGIVSFSGEDRYHLYPEDRGFDPTPEAILALAHRDAELQVPLTRDYDAADRKLREIGRASPSGMTDFAAGIGRALIELAHLENDGAVSTPRPDAQRVIQFLTDGNPRLPYDRKDGAWAAIHAAKLARSLGVRVNAFSLGKNAVTREVDDALRRMAARSRGRLVELDHPGDIVDILRATSFAYVDRVKLVNETTHQESDYISTAIDGSFYGEIPLMEGENRIRVVAVLHDDRETDETLRILYEQSPPDAQLAERLERIRRENEALIEQIRKGLSREIREARERNEAERSVELRAEPPTQ